MAVNVSTFVSVCLYCKTTSVGDLEKEFHEIYDEVGLELQLPTLIEKFFHIKVVNENKKTLCDDCVNRLIELYDLEEHANEQKFQLDGTSIEPESVYLKCEHEPEINLQNRVIAQPNDIAIVAEIAYTEDVEALINKAKSAIFTDQDIQSNNINAENFIPETFEIGLDQSYNSLICNSPVNSVINASEQESNEVIVFDEDDEDHNSDIENEDNLNQIDTQISIEELEVINNSQIHAIIEDEQVPAIANEAVENNCIYSEQNDLMEEHVYEDELENEALSEFSTNNSQNEENPLPPIENLQASEHELVYYEEHTSSDNEKECLNEIFDELENDNIELNSLHVETENSADIETESFNSNDSEYKNIYRDDDDDVAKIIDNNEDDLQDDAYSIEEEYLIEEITCIQEFDCVDINEYLEKALVTKFQDLQMDWKVECKLCHDKYNTFQEILNHACITQFEEEQQFCCIIEDCEESINNLKTLARHLILHHYDKLESIPIYGKCPDCQKTFSNFIDFNKHSCCRTIKRKTGSPNYCQTCDLDFQSLKRFVFHMQFHLTNHRPKVCLLCGKLFNNSNDFFEHTQYEHNPNADMACRKCDRIFKEKDVFDNHMELHEDSKYQFACKYCPKKYTNKFGLTQHMDIYHNNSKGLQCEYCEKEFVNNSSYRNHLKSHAADVQVESFICATCGLITNNSEIIKQHLESDADSPCYSSEIEEKILGLGYTCENCSIDFHTIKQLKQHRLSANHSDDLFHCGMCRRAFKTLRHMRNHSVNHKDFEKWQKSFPITRYFVCNVGDCEEFYPIWTSLYYHKKRPHKSKENPDTPTEFKCQFCQQLCTSKMSLAVHVARSHNNSNISCSHCKRTYKSQKLLQDHIDKYHTPIKCNICSKKFKNRRNLDSHNNLVHLSVKRYFCQYCKKGYFHKSEKEIHEKKVHPVFAYKCEICDFITNYSKSLEIHMDKHNNKQKFKCTICNKAFGRKQLLQVHIKRHQNKKDYICSNYLTESGCDAAFFTYNLLKVHIQTKHQNGNDRKRKRSSSNKYVVKIQDKSYEIYNSVEDTSTQVKRPKRTSVMDTNYDEFEQDALELPLKKDLKSQELKSDNEYDAICG